MTNTDNNSPEISIIVPVLNEQDTIKELYHRITSMCKKNKYSYEILIIDDGSTDHSFQLLEKIAESDGQVKLYQFRKNFGKTAAFTCGFNNARGKIIINLEHGNDN